MTTVVVFPRAFCCGLCGQNMLPNFYYSHMAERGELKVKCVKPECEQYNLEVEIPQIVLEAE